MKPYTVNAKVERHVEEMMEAVEAALKESGGNLPGEGPCPHQKTRYNDIGNLDCLDCGEEEIDYQEYWEWSQKQKQIMKREELIKKAREFLNREARKDPATECWPVIPSHLADFALSINTELAAKVEAYERMMERVTDIRGFSWHLLRRREDGEIQWLISDKGTVLGPFDSAIEAFEALNADSAEGK